jgi:tetratricopeptide (TPR) repeat protein
MKIARLTASSLLLVVLLVCSTTLLAQTAAPSPTTEAARLNEQGRQLQSQGKLDEAIALYSKSAEQASDKDLYEAQRLWGAALDLKGQYDDARKHLSKAIELALPDSKIQALKTMAVSYAFQGKAKEAAKYEQEAFNQQVAAKKFSDAAGTANELARIFLESGEIDPAFNWYQNGYSTASMVPAEKDLWEFRWEHAQARIASRRLQKDEAMKHVAAAKAILDKGTNPNQAIFFPYLTGYVAYYTGDKKTAIADLQKADQNDPFILVLLAKAYEESGDKTQADTYYRKVLAINSHNPTNAFARPLAKWGVSGAKK